MAMSLANEILAQDLTTVSAILRQGVDVNQLDEYGFTPLIEAAITNNIEMARLLISYGADVNLQDMTGGTALHWAVENNNESLCYLLLEKRANPNAYNFSGQSVLVMPILRDQVNLKKLLLKAGADLSFAQDFINTKLLGHIYELVGTADLIDPQNNYIEIDFEGFYLEFSLGLVRDSLAQFQNHFASRKLRRFNELTQITINVLDNAAKLIKYQQYQTNLKLHDHDIETILQQEPLLIPVAYEGHAITFLKLGNILAKCDRREDSRLYDNIVFYHVNNIQNFTKTFIKKLIYERSSDQFINEDLPSILGLQPITELKIEAQISGNCSWANVEAAIPTLFFLLLLVASNQKDLAQYKNMSLDFFKQWREWNRQRTLQFCIKSFKTNDSIRNVCKAEILAAVLFQRLRSLTEVNREKIESILSILTLPKYAHVLENYIRVYIYESRSEEGQEFAHLLKSYGVL
jgi:hypothetical protein